MANLLAAIDKLLRRSPGNRPRADWVVCDVASKRVVSHHGSQAAALHAGRGRSRNGHVMTVYTAYEARLRGYR